MLKRIRKNCDGIVALEFAFVAPILLFMSMLIVESALIMFYQSAIDDSLSTAVRTSKVTSDNRDNIIDTIKDKFQSSTYGIPDKESLIITSDLAVEFDGEFSGDGEICYDTNNVEVGVGTGLGMTCNCTAGSCPTNIRCEDDDGDLVCDAPTPALELGGPGDVVTLIAIYKWKPLTPGIKYFFTQPGNSSNNRNFSNVLQANESGEHIITSGMAYRNEE